MGRMYKRSRSRWAPYIRAGARVAGRLAYNVGKSYVKSRFSKRSTTTGVTNQYDRKTVYRRRRMPRRRRRRWVRFVKRVQAVEDKALATKTLVFNSGDSQEWADGSQRFICMHLYGKNGGGGELGAGDVWVMAKNDPNANESCEGMRFTSAIIDTTVYNGGETSLEFDVYEMYPTGKNHITPSWTSDQQYVEVNTPGVDNVYNNIDILERGCTPFDFPMMTKLGWRILKKTKYIMSPGQTFTYQHRDPKNRFVPSINVDQEGASTDLILSGATRTFLIIAKPVPGVEGTNKFAVGCTRTYRYKINQSNRNEQNYI